MLQQQQKQPLVCSSNGPKCRYTMDNKCPSMENGTRDESQGISESGWTMYFDQSLDECSDSYCNSRSLIGSEEDVGRNKGHEEDSSMASDASSGPQQPLDVSQLTEPQNGGQRILSSTDQDFKLSASHVAESRNTKRTRPELESDAADQKDLYLLEDTASSPVCSYKSLPTENDVHLKDFVQLSKALSKSLIRCMAYKNSRKMSQILIPCC